MLTPEDEYALAKRYRETGDAEAAHRLVASHLRLVVKIAMRYRGYGLPIAELISEGNFGIVRAIQRFDPELGVRLSSYAVWWIRAAIQEYVLYSWSMVKTGTTASQKKLFFSLRKLKRRFGADREGGLSSEVTRHISVELGVSEADVRDMNDRLSAPDCSLNAPIGNDAGHDWQDILVDEHENQEASLAMREELAMRRTMLRSAMLRLPERERDILTERRLHEGPATLEYLARKHGISRERVRQIEMKAIEKLQKWIANSAFAPAPIG
jgi:RNA polymerase sigma-32 factor